MSLKTEQIVAEHEIKIKSLEKRMLKVEDMNKTINEINVNIKEIATTQSAMLQTLKDEKETRKINEGRIKALEEQPAKDYHDIKQKVLLSVITTILGAVLGALLALIIKG